MTKKLDTAPYKGVRDFYPEDQAIQNYIFDIMRKTAESFGYVEYSASILEGSDLYEAKSGEEIVNEQTYTFKDRGERSVTLRPEMTPTVARMIAAKRKSMSFPVRWYSIPNLFRYEQPQRGRLREHFQLNCDIFGIAGIEAEIEAIALADSILKNFGLPAENYAIRINSRKIMDYIFVYLFQLDEARSHNLSKLIDKKHKIMATSFEHEANKILGEKNPGFLTMMNSKNFDEFIDSLPQDEKVGEAIQEIRTVLSRLEQLGITNVTFDQSLMRGFDYYTGIVFEIFDTNPENSRSLFGGGRYDNLLSIFGVEPVPTVGFGMGDVTIRDVLETYKLLPEFSSTTDLAICIADTGSVSYADELAQKLRESGLNIAVDYTFKRIGEQIKYADKQKIPFVTVIGENESSSGTFTIKELKTGAEISATEETAFDLIHEKVHDHSLHSHQ